MSEFDERIARMQSKRKAQRCAERVVIQQKVEQRRLSRDKKRDEMRLLMPKVASVVDALKLGFGDDQVKVLMAEENGVVVKAKGYRG